MAFPRSIRPAAAARPISSPATTIQNKLSNSYCFASNRLIKRLKLCHNCVSVCSDSSASPRSKVKFPFLCLFSQYPELCEGNNNLVSLPPPPIPIWDLAS